MRRTGTISIPLLAQEPFGVSQPENEHAPLLSQFTKNSPALAGRAFVASSSVALRYGARRSVERL